MDTIIVLASLVEIIFEVSSYASGAEEMSLTGMSGAGFPGFKHPPTHSTFRRQWIITWILPPSLSKIWIMADMAVSSKCINCLGLLESTPQNTNLEHYCLILFDIFYSWCHGKLCPSLRTIADELDLFCLGRPSDLANYSHHPPGEDCPFGPHLALCDGTQDASAVLTDVASDKSGKSR